MTVEDRWARNVRVPHRRTHRRDRARGDRSGRAGSSTSTSTLMRWCAPPLSLTRSSSGMVLRPITAHPGQAGRHPAALTADRGPVGQGVSRDRQHRGTGYSQRSTTAARPARRSSRRRMRWSPARRTGSGLPGVQQRPVIRFGHVQTTLGSTPPGTRKRTSINSRKSLRINRIAVDRRSLALDCCHETDGAVAHRVDAVNRPGGPVSSGSSPD